MTKAQLTARVRKLLGDISSTEYSDADILISLNTYYDDLITLAIQESGEWEVNGEVATANLVASQQEYTLPTDLLVIKRVEADFPDGTQTWTELPIKDMRNILTPLSNNTTDSDSNYCRIYDESLFLEHPVDDAVTGGLKIYYSKEATHLSANGDIPNLPNQLHEGLIYGACLDYAIREEQNKRIKLFKGMYDEIQGKTIKFYSNRLVAVRARLTPYSERYE